MVLTARAENYLHGRQDLSDTIARLQRYQEAGADVLFAPGLTSLLGVSPREQPTICPGYRRAGKPYETEGLIFPDKRSYKAIHAVFWSNDKFGELREAPATRPDGASN